MTKDGIVEDVRETKQKEAENMNYGLNDKNSKNYIADQNRRALMLRILMEQSNNFDVTADEILEAINN